MHRRAFIASILGAAFGGVLPPRSYAFPQKFRRFGALDTEHFDVVRVSESVFAVRGKAGSGIPTNSTIIVGEDGVAVVDAHLRPSLDREVIGIVRRITEQPLRCLINTHWHQDHTLGNQAFERECVIVAHEMTRNELATRVVENLRMQRAMLPDHVVQAREALAAMRAEGADAIQIEKLEVQIRQDEEYLTELSSIRVAAPTRVFREVMRLDIASQPIELRHPGLGHTRGDIVVHLPEERAIVLGDLVTAGQPFMRPDDAVPSQWAPTLRRIAMLNWDKGVIGHGWAENPRDRLNILATFLDALILQVRRAIDDNIPESSVGETVFQSLRQFASHFPYFEHAVFENISRAYAEQKAQKGTGH